VIVITSNIRLAHAPGNIFLRVRDSKLPKESVINISQLITLDRSLLTQRVGVLTEKIMNQVEVGLKLVLALE